MSREQAINLIQDKCRQIMEYAPNLEEYQSILANFSLPLSFTEIIGGTLTRAEETYTTRTRIYVQSLGEGLNDIGDPIALRARLMDEFSKEFHADNDDSNYLSQSQYGAYVLQADTVSTISLQEPFAISLPNDRGIVEYPLGTGQWFWVFDVTYNILEELC